MTFQPVTSVSNSPLRDGLFLLELELEELELEKDHCPLGGR